MDTWGGRYMGSQPPQGIQVLAMSNQLAMRSSLAMGLDLRLAMGVAE